MMHGTMSLKKKSYSYLYTLSTYSKLYCVQGTIWRLCF